MYISFGLLDFKSFGVWVGFRGVPTRIAAEFLRFRGLIHGNGMSGLGWDVPLILTVLNRDSSTPFIFPIKDCQSNGEHSKV